MKVSEIKTEIDSLIELLKSRNVEVPGVLYVADTCIKNMIYYVIEPKFDTCLFIAKLHLLAHEAIKNVDKTHIVPFDVINNAPRVSWNIHVTLSKIKETVNDLKIKHLIAENGALKVEIQKLKTKSSIFSWFKAAASLILPISILK